MTDRQSISDAFTDTLARLSRPLALTRLGMVAEALARAFWPFWSVVILTLGLLMLGVQDMVRVEIVWGIGAVLLILSAGFAIRGAMRFRWPSREAALARLDASLKGRPLQTLRDAQAIGAGDIGSESLWQAIARTGAPPRDVRNFPDLGDRPACWPARRPRARPWHWAGRSR